MGIGDNRGEWRKRQGRTVKRTDIIGRKDKKRQKIITELVMSLLFFFTDVAHTEKLTPVYHENNYTCLSFIILTCLFQFRDTGIAGPEPIRQHKFDRRQLSPYTANRHPQHHRCD